MKKDKLEQFFSDKLENFEAPYDANAWASVASKIGKGGPSSGLSRAAQSGLISVAAVFAGFVIYTFIFEEKTITHQSIALIEEPAEVKAVESSVNEIKEQTHVTLSENNANPESNGTPSELNEENAQEVELTSTTIANETSHLHNVESESSISHSNPVIKNVVTNSKNNFIAGHVSTLLLCKGENVTISNLGKEKEVVRFTVNGKTIQLTTGKKTSLTIHEATEIRFTNDKNELIRLEVIQILENPHPHFDVDANIYEEGLPVAKFTSYGNYKSISWAFGNDQTALGPEATAHYFDKGVFPVTLTVIGANGCIGTETKNVEISDKYNLLATNSIRLNDPNLETRTFMPFCLKERETKFNLTIIDPKDNSVVFSSNDTSKSWDGTDQRTGRLLPTYKTFIWQVQLETPMQGERGIYNGTVTIVE